MEICNKIRPNLSPSLLFTGCRKKFSRGYSDLGGKVTTFLYLLPTLKMGGVAPPLPHLFWWAGS